MTGGAALIPMAVGAAAGGLAGTAQRGGFKQPSDPLPGILSQQQAQATETQKLLEQTPKQISPDNFLSQKAGQLAKLRLGLASTIGGAGGVPSATLSAPSLTAAGAGKSKMGQ